MPIDCPICGIILSKLGNFKEHLINAHEDFINYSIKRNKNKREDNIGEIYANVKNNKTHVLDIENFKKEKENEKKKENSRNQAISNM